MSPRNKIIIIIASVSITIITGIMLLIMYLTTDMFKSSEVLFAKYFVQNFEVLDSLKSGSNVETEGLYETNPYISEVKANIKYIENIGTSDEKTNNIINKIGIKATNNIDKTNEYYYRDISVGTQNEDLFRVESLKDNDNYAVRLNKIKQFVSTNNIENNKDIKAFKIHDLEEILPSLEISKIISFSDEEKENLKNAYTNIIKTSVTKERYNKQKKTLITINDKDIQANAYSITLNIEEYNNIYIKILEKIKEDEIILAKIDELGNNIKKFISTEQSARELFVDYIQETIEEIQRNNIGNDEVKITVYESKGKTVRTSIERTANKIIFDIYNEKSFKINQVKLEEVTEERYLKFEGNDSNILVEYEDKQDNEIVKYISIEHRNNYSNNHLENNTDIKIANQRYESTLTVNNVVDFEGQLEDKVTLETDNVVLDELEEERKQDIVNILNENSKKQLDNLLQQVTLEDYKNMFRNLGIVRQNVVQLPGNTGVTDIERTRFNSQFEFFASSNLTKDNIVTLTQTLSNNFDDMKILLKDGTIEDLNLNRLKANNDDAKQYEENISEILVSIKENSKNETKENEILEYLEDNNDTYTVSLEYDDNGLVRIVRIKIEEE